MRPGYSPRETASAANCDSAAQTAPLCCEKIVTPTAFSNARSRSTRPERHGCDAAQTANEAAACQRAAVPSLESVGSSPTPAWCGTCLLDQQPVDHALDAGDFTGEFVDIGCGVSGFKDALETHPVRKPPHNQRLEVQAGLGNQRAAYFTFDLVGRRSAELRFKNRELAVGRHGVVQRDWLRGQRFRFHFHGEATASDGSHDSLPARNPGCVQDITGCNLRSAPLGSGSITIVTIAAKTASMRHFGRCEFAGSGIGDLDCGSAGRLSHAGSTVQPVRHPGGFIGNSCAHRRSFSNLSAFVLIPSSFDHRRLHGLHFLHKDDGVRVHRQ